MHDWIPKKDGEIVVRPRCVMTGASSGIGEVAAIALARRGFDLILICRSASKGQAIEQLILNEAPSANVDVHLCDLSQLDELHRVGQTIVTEYPEIHLLINNAGLITSQRIETRAGHEYMFAVNQLAPFVLTHALYPSLCRAAMRSHSATRVITVASDAHRRGTLQLDDLQYRSRRFSAYRVYCASKLANILFTRELDRRGQRDNVRAYCFHPGVVATRFGVNLNGPTGLVFRGLRPFLRSPQEGAQGMIYLATQSNIEEHPSRYYFDDRPGKVSRAAVDDRLAKELWKQCESLTGRSWPIDE